MGAIRKIRTIHHLAATGGTIMSRALAAQPGVVLLSEVAPVARSGFSPYDPVQQLVATRRRDLEHQIFADRLRQVDELVGDDILVLRAHPHHDIMKSSKPRPDSLLTVLDAHGFDRVSIATIRDPIDSWLSGAEHNWTAVCEDFDDYCFRAAMQVEPFSRESVFRYEDFVADPASVTEAMCAALAIPFDPTFMDRIHDNRLTGSSGRKPKEIAPLPRREISDDFRREIQVSPAYRSYALRFGYKTEA